MVGIFFYLEGLLCHSYKNPPGDSLRTSELMTNSQFSPSLLHQTALLSPADHSLLCGSHFLEKGQLGAVPTVKWPN